MFYSEFVLTKKGPFAKIWLAAHWDRRLTKNQITDTDIKDAVKGIIQPVVPLALRTSGHLLLGVVKIYSRKVKYVLADCNETLTRIKLQVVPETKVDLPERSLMANINAITLPERVSELDLIIPEYDLSTLMTTAGGVSGFIADTVEEEEEEIGRGRLFARMQDITLDDFDNWYAEDESVGMPSFAAPFGLTQTPAEIARPTPTTAPTPASVDQLRRAAPTFGEQEVFTTGIAFPMPGTEEEFMGMGAEVGFGGEEYIPTSPRREEVSRLSTAISEIGTPFVTPITGAPTEEVARVEAEVPRPQKRPRGVQIDARIEIAPKRYKAALTQAPLRETRSAPKTPAELEALHNASIDALPSLQDLMSQPASGADLPASFLTVFRRNLEQINVRQAVPPVEIPREAAEIQPEFFPEHEFGAEAGLTGFEEFEEFPPTERRISTMPSPISTVEDDIDDIIIDAYRTPEQRSRVSTALGTQEVAPLISEAERTKIIEEELERERELREKSKRDQEELRRTYTDKSMTERTLKVMNIFNETFKTQSEIDLNKMVAGKKRITAARCFYEVLVLKTKNFIDVKQDAPYADITITKSAISV